MTEPLAGSIGHQLVNVDPWAGGGVGGAATGGWWVFARPTGRPVTDLTFFRGTPIDISSFSFEDPFGPKDMTLTIPSVTAMDRLGHGDLYWMRKKVSLDLIWSGALPSAYPYGRLAGRRAAPTWMPSFAWEGYTTGFGYGNKGIGLQLNLKGGLYQLDDYMAKPEFMPRPLPYEWAIARQFTHTDRPALRLAPMQMYWPGWWSTSYTPPKKGTPHYLVPAGVKKGDKWSAMLTRDTGNWEPILTSYMAKLIAAMYTRRGRFTLDLQRGRVPTLSHRNYLNFPVAGCAVVELGSPAVVVNSLEVDWSQSLDIAYGQGVSLAGVAYSGMQVSSDGQRTFYRPLAALREAYPFSDNDWLDIAEMPREVLLQMPNGLSEYDAMKVAQSHLERFGDPGVTGELELAGDVKLASGDYIPAQLVRAGMPIQIRNLFGLPDGVTAHIASNEVDFKKKVNRVTIDSKYRDALTVEEVRLRGRDALNVPRMLLAGQYTPPLPDNLYPWNYAEGSGMIPSASFRNSRELFDGMPDQILFPWTKWTTAHPPRSARWRHCYLEIGPASANANNNWAGKGTGLARLGTGVRMSQAGDIRLLQFAAFDKDGHIFQVPFHVSFYYSMGVNVGAMPKIPAGESHPPYSTGQRYPFVTDGWEQYNTDGTEKGIEVPLPVKTAGLWKAYGTDKVKAGYFPGDGTGSPTGLLVVENVGSFDFTSLPQWNPYSLKGNLGHAEVGQLYAMVYCDAQLEEHVYFLGRMFRSEPGTQGGD